MTYTIQENIDHLATVLINVVHMNELDYKTLCLLRQFAEQADISDVLKPVLLSHIN